MEDNSLLPDLDATDRRILEELAANGRITTIELAEKVNLSATPCSRRIKRLEEAGVIEGYCARINPAALGVNLCVMISVKLARHAPDGHTEFLAAVERCPEITECLLVTGDADYLLKVWIRDVEALRDFTINTLQGIPAVAETSTTLVLKQIEGNLMRIA